MHKKKRAIKVSHSEHERLKTQVKQLKRESQMYKKNWMREYFTLLQLNATGGAATYFVEIGKILSGATMDSDE